MKKELLENKEFINFVEDMQIIFDRYIEEVQQVVVDNIEESFNNDAIRLLVKDYAEELRRVQKWNKSTLMDALTSVNGKVYVDSISVIHNYEQAIYTLCYRRYVKEDK